LTRSEQPFTAPVRPDCVEGITPMTALSPDLHCFSEDSAPAEKMSYATGNGFIADGEGGRVPPPAA